MITFAATAFSALPLVFASAAAPQAYIDPVAVAPEIYSIKLENDYVRTILTTARPGEFTPLHSHPGRVAIFLNDCTQIDVDGRGMASDRVFKAGDAVWAPAETHGDFRYRFTAECRIIEVEVKSAK
jgi:hypothetical protein